MNPRSHAFLTDWMHANARPEPERADADGRAEELAYVCLASAEAQGFTLKELEQAIGTDLTSHIWPALTAPRPANFDS